jgi:hypothetical protein
MNDYSDETEYVGCINTSTERTIEMKTWSLQKMMNNN